MSAQAIGALPRQRGDAGESGPSGLSGPAGRSGRGRLGSSPLLRWGMRPFLVLGDVVAVLSALVVLGLRDPGTRSSPACSPPARTASRATTAAVFR